VSELSELLVSINASFEQVPGITAPVISESMSVRNYLTTIDLLVAQTISQIDLSIKTLLEAPKEFDVSVQVMMLRGLRESLPEMSSEAHAALDPLDPGLTLASAWAILTGSIVQPPPAPQPEPPPDPSPEPTPIPHEVDYTTGVVPVGFGMIPASQAGLAAGFPLYSPSADDTLYQSPTIEPDQWNSLDESGNYIELLTQERVVSFLSTVSKSKFDDLSPYFFAKAIRDSGIGNFNLAQSFSFSKKLFGGLSVTLDSIDAWGDSISNVVNVYTFYKNTGKLPDGTLSVGLDDWAVVLKQNSSAFLANMLSGATLGLLTQSEAQIVTDTSIQGWELIINGAIDLAAEKMSIGIQTTNSFRYSIFANENIESSADGLHLAGGSDTDLLVGGSGNDVIYGGAGNDLLIGGEGNQDIALFNSARAAASVTRQIDGSLLVASSDGTDTLLGIERLHFSDGNKVAFDLNGNAGFVAKMLGALLGESSWNNKEYIGVALYQLDNAQLNFEQLMDLGLKHILGPNASNGSVVNLLYSNLLGTNPSLSELNEFVGLLDNGIYTLTSLGMAAANHDINAANIGLIGLLESGLQYFSPG
jgi:hypothetical protein